jgi:hypothetical protein
MLFVKDRTFHIASITCIAVAMMTMMANNLYAKVSNPLEDTGESVNTRNQSMPATDTSYKVDGSTTTIIPFANPDAPSELASWWQWYAGSSTASAYELTNDPNALTMLVGPGTDQWGSNKSALYVSYAISGDFEVEVKLKVYALTRWIVGGLGIMSSQDQERWIRIVYALDNKVYLNRNGQHLVITPYFDHEVYFKLRRNGSMISAYYSASGEDWTVLKENYQYELPPAVKIYLLGFTQLSSGDVIQFQDLKLSAEPAKNSELFIPVVLINLSD